MLFVYLTLITVPIACSHNKLSCVTCTVLSYLFLLSVFLSVTSLLIIKHGDVFRSFLFFPLEVLYL